MQVDARLPVVLAVVEGQKHLNVAKRAEARLVEATGYLPPSHAKQVRRFFAAHPVDEAKRALEKALEAMALREALFAREADNFSQWLDRHA